MCTKKCCDIPAFETSERMHGDDYKLNTQANVAIVANAMTFSCMAPFFEALGLFPINTTDHYKCKGELESPLALMAEESMAQAHERNVLAEPAGDNKHISVDGYYTHSRNAKVIQQQYALLSLTFAHYKHAGL